MIVVIGEILIDIFPSYQRIGGAPFNFAYHLKQLGFGVRFFTRVGDDDHGRRILDFMENRGFDAEDVQIDQRHPTGTVQVALDSNGVPHFDIRENVAYDHLSLESAMGGKAQDARMIYFGSLIQRSANGYGQVQEFLRSSTEQTTCFCDINMRPPHVNPRAIADSLHRADILKVNEEELDDIRRRLGGPPSADPFVSWLMARYAISTLAITRGSRGSTIVSGDLPIHHPMSGRDDVVDTVGAGDGYAAILAAGHINRIPWETVIDQASVFAARVCRIPGAIPDDERFYDEPRLLMKGNANGR
ncbi:fructokinase [Desulfosarcina ovata subsp. sediminis]|uniref:Fructokinase n=1 Tax=Desulfosarcina ovata subsp. sediminis TaxID=885957 RepID=A0A5K7ZKE2_9BACT|nr:carbohydrate kinase [Desulfosarcina ovata]BBO81371.1 fructokinase [Desulfosarcina ovata subsp. sediminis]